VAGAVAGQSPSGLRASTNSFPQSWTQLIHRPASLPVATAARRAIPGRILNLLKVNGKKFSKIFTGVWLWARWRVMMAAPVLADVEMSTGVSRCGVGV
jgi:hypothetical protein